MSFMVTRKVAIDVIRAYRKAWIDKDSEAIIKIFTKNGRYHEYVLKKPYKGHNEIKKYWEDKVVATQRNIRFKLLNLYIQKNVAVAESDIRFDDTKRNIGIHMKELMILEFKGNKISYLREYWSSEHLRNGKVIPK